MGNWRKYLHLGVAVLLANEVIICLVVNIKSASLSSLSQPQAAAMLLAENFVGTRPLGPLGPPDVKISEDEGLDDLRRACLSYDESSGTHTVTYRAVHGSWDGRTKDRNDVESFHLASRKNPWLRTSFVPDEGVPFFTSGNVNATWYPLMFIPAMFDASHCVHDLLFSLLPPASWGKLSEFTAVAVKRPEWSPEDDGPVRDWAGDYCTVVLRGLGWFKGVMTVEDGTCVEDLWVPPFMYRRFPRGWDKGTRGSNEYMHSKDMPMRMIHFFQQQMWKSFIADNPHLRRNDRLRIVFDTLEATGRGEWTNAQAVADLVRKELDPEAFVVEIVDDVGALTVKEQAALYFGSFVVVAPHGGSLANVVFMRPHQVVFELSCGETSWVRDWATDLRIRHAMVRAESVPCEVEGRRSYYVRPKALVDLILDIFSTGMRGSKKREGGEQPRAPPLPRGVGSSRGEGRGARRGGGEGDRVRDV